MAWVVARIGETARPPEPAPRPMKPFLRFARLPAPALDVTRRVLDDDVEFRARVLGAASEPDVGRPSWLFLARPEGWEDELRELEQAAAGLEEQLAEEAGERDARRRLKRTEDARDEALAALEAARAETARLEVELVAERDLRRAIEVDLAEAREMVRKLTAEAGSSRAAAERARQQRAALEAEAARLVAEVERVEADLAEMRTVAAAASDVAAVDEGVAEAAPVEEAPVVEAPVEEPVVEAPVVEAPAPSRFDEVAPAVRAAVADAAAAAARLGEALSAAAAALAGPDEPDSTAGASGAGAPGGDEGSAPDTAMRPIAGMGDVVVSRARERGRTHRPPRPSSAEGGRVPSPLPPAVFHDSVAAADHLVRLNGVVVLVDGYNVSKEKWPELAIAEQRGRLVDALGGLAARTGADVHTVFDGAEQPGAVVSNVPRRAVKVTFSPPDVEADDVLIALVDTIPLHRPVVVVSSDRRVQEGCGCRGANVISSQQLLAIL